MFERWGFLLTEIFVLLAIAALLGLFVGWLIWGRRPEVAIDTSEADRLRGELTACTTRGKDMSGRIAGLERDLADTKARVTAPVMPAPVMAAPVVAAPLVAAPVVTAPVVAAPVMAAPVLAAPVIAAPSLAAPQKAAKPKGLTAARGG